MENAQPVKQSTGGWKRRFGFAAIVSAALAFTLCFFGPLDLFFNNYEELWFNLQDILPGVAIMALILFACGTLLGTLLRGKLHNIYMALMFGGLLGLYVQGSFMNKDYGTLNGTAVDWSAYTGYGVMNTIVWVVCIALPLVLMLVLKDKKMRPVLMFLSCALILMQGASLVVSYVNYPEVTESATLTTDGIYDLSKEENTIIFVVDTLDEAYFEDMMDQHPEYAEQLQGFTSYSNALASGARTPVALPLILTGIPRTEPGTYADYMDYVWTHQTVFNDLKDAGYEIRLGTQSRFVSTAAQGIVENLEMSSSSVGNLSGLIRKMYKLTCYKYSPHILKWRFWMSTSDFDKYMTENEYVVNDARFYKNYQKNDGFTYTDEDKCFRLYHLRGSHDPLTLKSDGTRSDGTTSREEQTEGNFHIIFDMLNNMRENGVYDNANIFIIADHGDNDKAQWAACLYKPAGATGKYTVSNAPVSFLDLTSTLDKIAGGDYTQVGSGRPLEDIKENETRTRTMYLNNGTFVTGMYQTDSHASDADQLKLVKEYQLQDASSIEPYTLGTELSFSITEATGNVYCTHGFRTAMGATTTMEGHQSQMVIPIEDPPKNGELTVSLTYRDVVNATNMVITAGGEQVFEQDMKAQSYEGETITFNVPVTTLKDNQLTLDFTFADIPESEEEQAENSRTQTVRISKLVITAGDQKGENN